MNLEELRTFKPQIMQIAAQYGVSDIRVFGSVARGDADANSDVDLMIDRFQGSLLRFMTFKNQLEDLLGSKVDVCKPINISHPIIMNAINRDAVSL